ncbi:hypothetical protein DFH09DRAFT_1323874 [Mycena vulgaris]|nr:hypothetical protein DFH09DRAFT_1323874 [Mycena vulgaris]
MFGIGIKFSSCWRRRRARLRSGFTISRPAVHPPRSSTRLAPPPASLLLRLRHAHPHVLRARSTTAHRHLFLYIRLPFPLRVRRPPLPSPTPPPTLALLSPASIAAYVCRHLPFLSLSPPPSSPLSGVSPIRGPSRPPLIPVLRAPSLRSESTCPPRPAFSSRPHSRERTLVSPRQRADASLQPYLSFVIE